MKIRQRGRECAVDLDVQLFHLESGKSQAMPDQRWLPEPHTLQRLGSSASLDYCHAKPESLDYPQGTGLSGVQPSTGAEPAKLPNPHRCAQSSKAVQRRGGKFRLTSCFSALCSRPGFDPSFLGCAQGQVNQKFGATISQPFSDREYLYAVGQFDWFKFSNRDPTFPSEFRRLLGLLEPQILHFHHYMNFGVEAFLHVRRSLPDCKIVVTLHEFLAICHHYGQMVRSDRQTLCHEASPLRCNGCFNEITPSDFFLRELYIKRFFELVDHFIAPSEFLAGRYTAWGIPNERISVIENVVPNSRSFGKPVQSNGDVPLRVGYFGQISILKGINVLFDTAKILDRAGESGIVLEIFGDYHNQPAEFQQDFLKKLDSAWIQRQIPWAVRSEPCRPVYEFGRPGARSEHLVGEFTRGHSGGPA